MSLMESRYIARSIQRPPDEVYRFASDPRNLPRWASGLAGSVEPAGDHYRADSPMGKVEIRFAADNAFGVLDHDVRLESGLSVHNAMRVIPNGTGSDVVFALFRRPDMSQEEFERDAATVAHDLETLKNLLEQGARELRPGAPASVEG